MSCHTKHNHSSYISLLFLVYTRLDLTFSLPPLALMLSNSSNPLLQPVTDEDQDQPEPGLPITELTRKWYSATWLVAMTFTSHRMVQ